MSRNFTPDETLIDRLLLNDTEAFEEIHHRYAMYLYSYSLNKLGSKEDARKITRDIFIALWESRTTLPVNFSISYHLYAAVRREVIRYVYEKTGEAPDWATIEKQIIPGFQLARLQSARQPVSYSPAPPVIHQKRYDERWWNQVRLPIKLSTVKYSFLKLLHFV
jgi:DNA-directed RNA polymerase specialized sigma24 family protein